VRRSRLFSSPVMKPLLVIGHGAARGQAKDTPAGVSLGLIRGVGLQEKWSRRDAGEVHRFALLCRHWALGKSDEFQGVT